MKTFVLIVAAMLCASSAAAADRVEKFSCTRVSGGPMKPFDMTINFDAKNIDLPSSTGMVPDWDSLQMTDSSITWGFMRGSVDFMPKTGEFDWDETDDYDYLVDIDQPPDLPESDFKGIMHCDVAR